MNYKLRSLTVGFGLLTALSLLPGFAHGYFSTIDTAEPTEVGKYRFTGEGQLSIQPHKLGHTSVKFDTGLDESSSFRGVLGTGALMPIEWGLFHKWNPIPDNENQPAISLISGALLGRNGDTGSFTLRVQPLVSKNFEIALGTITPYATLPLGATWTNGSIDYPVQFSVGGNLAPSNWPNVSVWTELGLSVANTFSYVSVAVSLTH
jgi:hypothetical protein